ncbi:hypothetical protein HAPAU_33960 [Halalkalicoccus paucihalophilus]|uniref:Uncharacterized protein n=1 Tax=Halalkalicoccus paucihalophilus TaxID=1008153 RepID=A0A151A9X7_9EURY|nr:hypothetical protein [Halalkalicoccus paucihalophilus]KYH24413.1 hypothetical protein HAPAU_33960 [Halalkalicoccus paucihalophilus]
MHDRGPPRTDDLRTAAANALAEIEEITVLAPGLEVGITAGSKEIHDMPVILRTLVDELEDSGLKPFVFVAMVATVM